MDNGDGHNHVPRLMSRHNSSRSGEYSDSDSDSDDDSCNSIVNNHIDHTNLCFTRQKYGISGQAYHSFIASRGCEGLDPNMDDGSINSESDNNDDWFSVNEENDDDDDDDDNIDSDSESDDDDDLPPLLDLDSYDGRRAMAVRSSLYQLRQNGYAVQGGRWHMTVERETAGFRRQ